MKIGNIICCFCVIILLEIFGKSHCETPLSTCPFKKPFRAKDGCANFTDICIKNDDAECKRFLTACEQCPPSNMTNILLHYIQAEIKSQKSDIQLLFLQLENTVHLTRSNKTEVITILLIIIIVINIFLVIILLIEIRFKLITKCLHVKSKILRGKEYQKLNKNNQDKEMGPSVAKEISNVIGQNLETSNILLGKDNTIKLSGFDLSKYSENKLVTSRVGTYRYMAPEILKGDMYGCEIDVWSFGVTLIEIATGKKIYPDLNELDFVSKISESDNISWDSIPENSETLVKFINMCLIFDPQTRATVEELLNHTFLKME